MLRKFVLNNSERFLSRWVVLLFDISVVTTAYLIAVFIRFNFEPDRIEDGLLLEKIPIVLASYLVGFILGKSYVGVIRHTSIDDAFHLFRGSMIGLVTLVLCSFVFVDVESLSLYLVIPRSISLIHFLLGIFVLIGSRFMVKVLYQRIAASQNTKRTRVLIYGAGVSGIITKNTLLQDRNRDYEIQGFIDENSYKIGKSIEGVTVFSPSKVFDTNFISKNGTDQIIISIQKNLSSDKKKEIVELALEKNLIVKVVPPVESWIHGELSAKQIKTVKIEDLLERDPIVLDNVNIRREVKGRTVLVTGAAGSIGSEISRQLLHYNPKKVILLDQAESALYDLECELRQNKPESMAITEYVIADISDARRMKKSFTAFEPDIVFHAAAYKHVPLMEDNPYEAVNTNVLGTKIVADLSIEFGVDKFVMVSTDKAVNPTNVMGATKRTSEIYTQSVGRRKGIKTQFIITRFGNVLGSNGSVIPLFRKQIENGGPVTITHRDITRFFMTIPEACNLVLEAGAMGKGGEIFVFDMGESVKIYDLAKKMIKLSGLQLGKDIEIKEVGLRPGEKLYEELLATEENTKPTYHPKIMIAEVDLYNFEDVSNGVSHLIDCLDSSDNLEMVKCLKSIVPEYISNNSVFASLDLKKIVNE